MIPGQMLVRLSATIGRAMYPAALLCVIGFLFPGCLTPYARYTRPLSEVGVSDKSSLPKKAPHKPIMVSASWDYRKDYKIPTEKLQSIITSYLGTPYRYGGTSRKGLDCSGFVKTVFTQLNKARLPRSSEALYKKGVAVTLAEARFGDFVFFKNKPGGRVDHVGIYIGQNRFAHASTKIGVAYGSLDNEYYKKHFVGVRRLF
jgi:hypothetical protein